MLTTTLCRSIKSIRIRQTLTYLILIPLCFLPLTSRPAQTQFVNHAPHYAILERTFLLARKKDWDQLPFNQLIIKLSLNFVGKPYIPGTLEQSGSEQLVINLKAFDCVTLIENVLALAALIKNDSLDGKDPEALRQQYRKSLTSLRYRDGELQGYTSRLHYFSEWLSDNEAKGQLDLITEELGGLAQSSPIYFMSANKSLFSKLKRNTDRLQSITVIEKRLNQSQRFYIPQEEIELSSSQIQDGDIIAATSNIAGLDVVHTGFAYWDQGALKLIHAPLIGKDVQISKRPLHQRILAIRSQNGIMVARPVEP
ncbi:MAG: N-acetylmuramoyl-L-alanine amidase-like domain-containing protein [Endozoicomonas sp.]|uniref:N-acetylmuramoyl-L-alanine amidase-like domain-containing protein n=1 Tax=Endozoicomonas sp. TaxID=1892382 RepID=UPI003D9B536B